ncbi:acyl-CoA dehydrogenase family protein [Tomitella fengzijianii]|uniref:Acyl-CoA dehydrogenase n=1 Tax=Tomitella fengzijianii TaxID=2597660 RepID=A0A516X167_9ACTN|nr:acyl-CoA dehydrogenase family protein [Tomitella fengzijianii]QDQ96826.1 acyl-CoA dehydrogenase [Tomitella fengzijianii]
MDFTRTEAQDDLAGLTRDICEKLSTPDRQQELDEVPGRFDSALHAALADAGILSAAVPAPAGGGFSILEQTAVLRELGRALAGTPYLPSIVMAADALATYGSPAHVELACRAADGETILTAALEESLTADPSAPATTATRSADGGHWVLSGGKTAVPFADECEAMLVPATLVGADRDQGPVGVFVVPATEVRITRQDGTDHSSLAAVDLEAVTVPDGARLGAVDGPGPDADGQAVLTRILQHGTVGLCAQQFGVLERSLELTAEYAREREQFDRPIGSFQAVAQRLADAFIDVKAARLTFEQAAWRLAEGLDADDAVRIAKFWAADAGHRVAHTTVHVHGGVGLDRDHPVHRYFLAAKTGEFRLGSATAQLTRIGAQIAG